MISPIFVSHGSPTLIFDDVPARDFLRGLGASLPRPKAILVVSAHWETNIPAVNAVAVNETIHDFGGFPQILFDQRYPAPGDPALAAQIAALIRDAGLPAGIDTARGLDHGAWVPLKLMYPENDIPVLQLSVQTHLGPAHHLRLGQALRSLADEGVLILGSGSFTHDLRSVDWRGNNVAPDWVTDFADWVNAALAEERIEDLAELSPPCATRGAQPSDGGAFPAAVRGARRGRACGDVVAPVADVQCAEDGCIRVCRLTLLPPFEGRRGSAASALLVAASCRHLLARFFHGRSRNRLRVIDRAFELFLHRGGEGHAEAVIDQGLVLEEEVRVGGGHLGGELQRGGDEVFGLVDAVDEAPFFGGVRVEKVAGEARVPWRG